MGFGNAQSYGLPFSSLSGDVTATNAGVVTLAEPSKLYVAQITLNKDGVGATGAIVGNAAGSIGHASGVQVIAGQGVGKIIHVLQANLDYTAAVAFYTAGNNVNLGYFSAGTLISAICTAQNAAGSFADPDSGNSTVFFPTGIPAYAAGVNVLKNNLSVNFYSQAQFTNPGTAAGTAKLTVLYTIYTVP